MKKLQRGMASLMIGSALLLTVACGSEGTHPTEGSIEVKDFSKPCMTFGNEVMPGQQGNLNCK